MKRFLLVLFISSMLYLSAFSSQGVEDVQGKDTMSSSTVISISSEMMQLRKGIKIINVHYSSSDEYVEIMNTTDKPVNLQGLLLVSGTNSQQYVFGDIILEPQEILELHSGPDATGLVWTYEYVHRDTTDGVLLTEINGSYISGFRWGR